MEIIALREKPKTGKTTTLVQVAELIKKSCNVSKQWYGKKDCCILATREDKTIMLISVGDNVDIIKRNLERMLGKNLKN